MNRVILASSTRHCRDASPHRVSTSSTGGSAAEYSSVNKTGAKSANTSFKALPVKPEAKQQADAILATCKK